MSSIYKGNTKIKTPYIGNRKIKKIYKGNQLLWQGTIRKDYDQAGNILYGGGLDILDINTVAGKQYRFTLTSCGSNKITVIDLSNASGSTTQEIYRNNSSPVMTLPRTFTFTANRAYPFIMISSASQSSAYRIKAYVEYEE